MITQRTPQASHPAQNGGKLPTPNRRLGSVGARGEGTPLESLDRLGRLVAPVVKEIRNPLSVLLAASEMLIEEMGSKDPSSGFARLISEETSRVQETISDLAVLAEPRAFNPCAMDLLPLLEEIVTQGRSEIERHGVHVLTVCPETPIYVRVDRDALRLAFEKLLRQAIEAMPYGGTLSVHADLVNDGANQVARVVFSDEGPQVSVEAIPRIFEPFLILPGRRPGMSLALCRMIVERLGGRVAAWSGGEAGLAIEVRLPLP